MKESVWPGVVGSSVSIGSMGESWRRIDRTSVWRKYCGGDGVGSGF